MYMFPLSAPSPQSVFLPREGCAGDVEAVLGQLTVPEGVRHGRQDEEQAGALLLPRCESEAGET